MQNIHHICLETSKKIYKMMNLAVRLGGRWFAVPLRIVPYSTQERGAQSRRPLRARAHNFHGSHAITAIVAIITVIAIILIIAITAIFAIVVLP